MIRPVSWWGIPYIFFMVGCCSHGVAGLSFLPELCNRSEPQFSLSCFWKWIYSFFCFQLRIHKFDLFYRRNPQLLNLLWSIILLVNSSSKNPNPSSFFSNDLQWWNLNSGFNSTRSRSEMGFSSKPN